MFLKQIKLSGFKSFVEPTSINFNSKLIGVVGPNGCGKSNIIDAVRWVMGESSAKTLRGESMADVIFNGSTTRKPVGQASIELVFDNCGNLRGEYAAYAEIALRREVNRDGQSNYYLNGSHCRRRDIVDVFLGTGIGPRSYSIIGQGMVSQVIEADPYNLKNFIDEASGVSVYKARRHETELRMKHTQENLTRINDLKAEQEKVLEKLKRQAQTAERYYKLKKECDLVEAKWLLLKLNLLASENIVITQKLQTTSVAIEQVSAEISSIDSRLITEKLVYEDKLENLQEVQRNYYTIGEKTARLEQDLQHTKQQQAQNNQELCKLQQEKQDLAAAREKDAEELANLEKNLVAEMAHHDLSLQKWQDAQEVFLKRQEVYNTARTEYEQLQKQLIEHKSNAEIVRQKITYLENIVKNANLKETRLVLEQQQLEIDSIYEQWMLQQGLLREKEEKHKELREKSNKHHKNLEELRSKLKTINVAIEPIRNELQVAKSKYGALSVLQEDSLKDNTTIELEFFATNKLGDILQVEPGFELAVEMALKTYLSARITNEGLDKERLLSILQYKVNTVIMTDVVNVTTKNDKLVSLAEKIIYPQEARKLVANFYVVSSADDLLEKVNLLDDNECLVTIDGCIFNNNAIIHHQDRDSILQRKVLLTELHTTIETLKHQEHNLVSQREQIDIETIEEEKNIKELQQTLDLLQKELRVEHANVSSMQTKHQHLALREKQIQEELEEQRTLIIQNDQEIRTLRASINNSLENIEALQQQESVLLTQKNALHEEYIICSENVHVAQKTLHTYEVSTESVRQKIVGMKNLIVRLTKQQEDLQARITEIIANITKQDPKISSYEKELQNFLSLKLEAENLLNITQNEVTNLHNIVVDLENSRLIHEKDSNSRKEEFNNLRLEQQALTLQIENQQEALQKIEIDLALVKTELTSNNQENMQEYAEKITTLKNKINNLGAINLAALEELTLEQEKHTHLNAQIADLTDALDTLANAIRKIDKETKEKFMDTFEKINANFQKLFPQLFGGGEAFLELTENDVLQSGIMVVARPPGKRNSTIHLLSGGEKALTAVAFIFAIFKLNPAPFCMLDEVDAPLDDANVIRFCSMLKEMANEVQFIFITHNKITMEIAEQLCGVTMKEPGVSRLVAVNINEAVSMAEA